jgi:hypothetical protein
MNRIEMLDLLPQRSCGAEIGVAQCLFANEIIKRVNPLIFYLIDCWKHQDGNYGCDPANCKQEDMDHMYEQALLFKNDYKDGEITIIRDFSLNAAPLIPDGFFDWIYLDANHNFDNVLFDLVAYEPKIKKNGIILGHDYRNDDISNAMGFGVVRAVDSFCKIRKWKIVTMTDDEWPSYLLKRENDA